MHSKIMVIAALALFGCNPDEVVDDDDTITTPDDTGSDVPDPTDEVATTLSWDIQNLAPLGDGYVYEGWAIVDMVPVSTGRFGVDANGVAELTTFELTEDQVADLGAFVLSIEPEMDDKPEPSAVKLLGGNFVADTATLSIDHDAALGDDLTGAVGPYILETPSTPDNADDYNNGIWWLGIDVPSLPPGWQYEGWVVVGGVPMSTGTFTAGGAPDSDGAGPTAGIGATPMAPGQDLIDPPVDLIGATAVISIEPVPDDSAMPFLLKPLVDADIEDVGPGVSQAMTNQAADNSPTGTVTLM